MQHTILLVLLTLILSTSCETRSSEVRFDRVTQYTAEQLDESIAWTKKLLEKQTKSELIANFRKARIAYKKAEPFARAINPESTNKINGPPLPIYSEDSGKILPAVGFQAIGEQVFGDEMDSALFKFQVEVTLGYLQNSKQQTLRFPSNPRRFFPAVQQQFLTIFSLGVTGFDTPSSLYGISESEESLRSLSEVYELTLSDTIKTLDKSLDDRFKTNLENAALYLDKHSDFETFDRYAFGREHLNNLTRDWVAIRRITGLFGANDNLALNLDAPTFFEKDAFNVDFFQLNNNQNPSDKKIALGKRLFFENRLSKEGGLSCGSCHIPEMAYSDGLKVAKDKNGNNQFRNTPTLINAIYQKKFFWDGRSDNIEQQISNVFSNEVEFNSSHEMSTEIFNDSSYQRQFIEVFGEVRETNKDIIKALSSFVGQLSSFNSKFDKNMRNEESTFSQEEILGMNLYMGKALCSTCHFIPLTNGTVPPLFKESEKEILGTPKDADNKEIDPDEGFFWVFESEIHKYMFKTPTLRNAAITAPYMHNGVYETLEEVMDFYNRGGGAGMGFDIPHQTLPFDSLSLNQEEISAIIAFMKTLTDADVASY